MQFAQLFLPLFVCFVLLLFALLSRSGYSTEKISENISAEILEVVLNDARECYPNTPILECKNEVPEDLQENLRKVQQTLQTIVTRGGGGAGQQQQLPAPASASAGGTAGAPFGFAPSPTAGGSIAASAAAPASTAPPFPPPSGIVVASARTNPSSSSDSSANDAQMLS